MSSCVKTARCSAERLSFNEAKQAFDQLGLNKISPNGLREDTFRCSRTLQVRTRLVDFCVYLEILGFLFGSELT
ncbi:hypothetical protein PGT21_005866 [Puccinia graminis f. sp. tritici]|uniref:Uncharacterized protein n=1 Tax=Puccinia graminis f. sp. tritici TaxID=56615 RepID=A0A5B0MEP2_PUCGR|nr:hypothetical protein PGT21_005866 [Puccinia graminis f. sp. tritici]